MVERRQEDLQFKQQNAKNLPRLAPMRLEVVEFKTQLLPSIAFMVW